jgi:steroid delta-isomerase-like uncharacterized protein
MGVEENKYVVRRSYEEGVNVHNMEVIDELFDSQFIGHIAGQVEPIRGREAFKKQQIMPHLAAFPDLHVTVVDMIAEGDMVAAREVIQGTHQSEFMGVPPTGKQISIAGTDIYRIVAGKIAEEWILADLLSALQQIGAIPKDEQTKQ